jgi:hypothetical protein
VNEVASASLRTGEEQTAQLRRSAYVLLIMVAAGIVAGRILNVQLVYEPALHRPADRPDLPGRVWPKEPPRAMPTFSSNDRSRWATVRALVEQGTYVIGKRDPTAAGPANRYGDVGIVFEDGWGTVDKVLHPATGEYYSSKPPFLATLIAPLYGLLYHGLGWTLTDRPWEVVRLILFVVNGMPLVAYLMVLAWLVDHLGESDWGRLLVVAAACFGTFLTTFATTLNNHLPAACATLFALATVSPVWTQGQRQWWRFAGAGFLAAFAACCELPAAAFAAGLFVALVSVAPRLTLTAFLLGTLPPLAFFFVTNYLALGTLIPVQAMFGSEWYLYEGSHWLNIQRNPRGIDAAQDPKPVYLLHLLLGHHGFFSLMPIFLLAVVGIGLGFSSRRPLLRVLAWLTPAVSLLVLAFYLVKSNNYGGWTSGPRWFFWLIPLWLLLLVPAADRLARWRWGRTTAAVLLGLSALHVHYPAWNPWRHPSLYNLLEYWQMIRY